MRLRSSLSLVILLSFPVGCAASADGEEESADVTACPATTSATVAALRAVAAQAAQCGAEPPASPNLPGARFEHTTSSLIAAEAAHHRGRDAFYAVGEAQWVLGKFAYGPSDKDLEGEAVEVFVQRGCAGAWEKIAFGAPVLTSEEHEHPTVEGVEDSGGRVFAEIPAAQRLGIGQHRVRMIVAGDRTYADQIIEVLPRGTPIFVSDVDGTLTERKPQDVQLACDEESDFPALWRGFFTGEKGQPNVHQGAPTAYAKLVSLGYRPMYLTARPEWLVPHTHAFLKESARGDGRGNLPNGVVHTTLGLTGAFNSAAEAFKKAEIQSLVAKGFKVVFGFGNRPSDVATYKQFGVPYRFYFENLDTQARSCSTVLDVPLLAAGGLRRGDWRIRSYDDLAPKTARLGAVCP